MIYNKYVVPHGQRDRITGELVYNNGFIILDIQGKKIIETIYEVGWSDYEFVPRTDLRPRTLA